VFILPQTLPTTALALKVTYKLLKNSFEFESKKSAI